MPEGPKRFILAPVPDDQSPMNDVSVTLVCYRCGASLARLTPPLSRRDLCPSCSVHLHVCRMCEHFDRQVLGQCREEDAEEVLDKELANYCEWFRPKAGAFVPDEQAAHAQAEAKLKSLFGETGADESPQDPNSAADDLFK